jgi:DNA-binding LytR/AlgR family response regulator
LLEEVQSPRNPRLLPEETAHGILIALNLIDWAEADLNYLKLHIGANTYTVRGTIEGIEKKLDSEQFLRINRSSLIALISSVNLQKWTHGEYGNASLTPIFRSTIAGNGRTVCLETRFLTMRLT